MGTFVLGIEMSNMAQLLSFFDFYNARSLIVRLYIYILEQLLVNTLKKLQLNQ